VVVMWLVAGGGGEGGCDLVFRLTITEGNAGMGLLLCQTSY